MWSIFVYLVILECTVESFITVPWTPRIKVVLYPLRPALFLQPCPVCQIPHGYRLYIWCFLCDKLHFWWKITHVFFVFWEKYHFEQIWEFVCCMFFKLIEECTDFCEFTFLPFSQILLLSRKQQTPDHLDLFSPCSLSALSLVVYLTPYSNMYLFFYYHYNYSAFIHFKLAQFLSEFSFFCRSLFFCVTCLCYMFRMYLLLVFISVLCSPFKWLHNNSVLRLISLIPSHDPVLFCVADLVPVQSFLTHI